MQKYIFASKAVFPFKTSLWTDQHREVKALLHFFCLNVIKNIVTHITQCDMCDMACVTYVINLLSTAHKCGKSLIPCVTLSLGLTPFGVLYLGWCFYHLFALQPPVLNNSGYMFLFATNHFISKSLCHRISISIVWSCLLLTNEAIWWLL